MFESWLSAVIDIVTDDHIADSIGPDGKGKPLTINHVNAPFGHKQSIGKDIELVWHIIILDNGAYLQYHCYVLC